MEIEKSKVKSRPIFEPSSLKAASHHKLHHEARNTGDRYLLLHVDGINRIDSLSVLVAVENIEE